MQKSRSGSGLNIASIVLAFPVLWVMTLPHNDTIQHWDAMTLDTDTKLKFFLNKYLANFCDHQLPTLCQDLKNQVL